MRLIDADALKAEWPEPTDWLDRDQVLCHITWFRAVIDNMPTIDPVKHGRWITTEYNDGSVLCECSYCGHARPRDGLPINYCPNCGCRMEEVTE